MKLRILLADDHEIVRRGLCALLQKREGWEVCGEASDGREAIEMAKQLKPDVVIVDIGMPFLNGLDTTRQLIELDPSFKVIVLTITDSDQVIREALDAGARGFVLKSDAARDLVSAVEAIQSKRMFFHPAGERSSAARLPGQGSRHLSERSAKLADSHRPGTRSDSTPCGRKEFQGSCHPPEPEHQNRGNASQQYYA